MQDVRLAAAIPTLIATLAFGGNAAGQSSEGSPQTHGWGGAVRVGGNFGGEEVASVTYSDGSQSDLSMGRYDAITVGAGYRLALDELSRLELVGLIGFGSTSTGPENTDDRLKLQRMPIELLAFWQRRIAGDWAIRVGAGGAYHVMGSIEGEGSISNLVPIDIENGLGVVGEVAGQWAIVDFGVRYTAMSLQATGVADPLDASSLGFFVGILFPP